MMIRSRLHNGVVGNGGNRGVVGNGQEIGVIGNSKNTGIIGNGDSVGVIGNGRQGYGGAFSGRETLAMHIYRTAT
jgi:hypothetical protein